MSQRIDITGKKYGRLLVIGHYHSDMKKSYWKCKCECGNEIICIGDNLKNGHTKSCGCLRKDKCKIAGKQSFKHGYTGKRLLKIWQGMKQRCINITREHYKYYGGKGIKVCREWLDSRNFIKWAIANGYQENLTIDRINGRGDYEPGNCRWVTMKVQNQNKWKGVCK